MGAHGQDIAKLHVLHQEKAVRMKAPADLSLKARKLWKRIVDAYPASHFKAGDDVLLKRYCEAAITADQEAALLAEEGNIIDGKGGLKLNPRRILLQILTNTLNQTAVKLRICPSGRTARAVGDQQEPDKKRNARAGLMFGG